MTACAESERSLSFESESDSEEYPSLSDFDPYLKHLTDENNEISIDIESILEFDDEFTFHIDSDGQNVDDDEEKERSFDEYHAPQRYTRARYKHDLHKHTGQLYDADRRINKSTEVVRTSREKKTRGRPRGPRKLNGNGKPASVQKMKFKKAKKVNTVATLKNKWVGADIQCDDELNASLSKLDLKNLVSDIRASLIDNVMYAIKGFNQYGAGDKKVNLKRSDVCIVGRIAIIPGQRPGYNVLGKLSEAIGTRKLEEKKKAGQEKSVVRTVKASQGSLPLKSHMAPPSQVVCISENPNTIKILQQPQIQIIQPQNCLIGNQNLINVVPTNIVRAQTMTVVPVQPALNSSKSSTTKINSQISNSNSKSDVIAIKSSSAERDKVVESAGLKNCTIVKGTVSRSLSNQSLQAPQQTKRLNLAEKLKISDQNRKPIFPPNAPNPIKLIPKNPKMSPKLDPNNKKVIKLKTLLPEEREKILNSNKITKELPKSLLPLTKKLEERKIEAVKNEKEESNIININNNKQEIKNELSMLQIKTAEVIKIEKGADLESATVALTSLISGPKTAIVARSRREKQSVVRRTRIPPAKPKTDPQILPNTGNEHVKKVIKTIPNVVRKPTAIQSQRKPNLVNSHSACPFPKRIQYLRKNNPAQLSSGMIKCEPKRIAKVMEKVSGNNNTSNNAHNQIKSLKGINLGDSNFKIIDIASAPLQHLPQGCQLLPIFQMVTAAPIHSNIFTVPANNIITIQNNQLKSSEKIVLESLPKLPTKPVATSQKKTSPIKEKKPAPEKKPIDKSANDAKITLKIGNWSQNEGDRLINMKKSNLNSETEGMEKNKQGVKREGSSKSVEVKSESAINVDIKSGVNIKTVDTKETSKGKLIESKVNIPESKSVIHDERTEADVAVKISHSEEKIAHSKEVLKTDTESISNRDPVSRSEIKLTNSLENVGVTNTNFVPMEAVLVDTLKNEKEQNLKIEKSGIKEVTVTPEEVLPADTETVATRKVESTIRPRKDSRILGGILLSPIRPIAANGTTRKRKRYDTYSEGHANAVVADDYEVLDTEGLLNIKNMLEMGFEKGLRKNASNDPFFSNIASPNVFNGVKEFEIDDDIYTNVSMFDVNVTEYGGIRAPPGSVPTGEFLVKLPSPSSLIPTNNNFNIDFGAADLLNNNFEGTYKWEPVEHYEYMTHSIEREDEYYIIDQFKKMCAEEVERVFNRELYIAIMNVELGTDSFHRKTSNLCDMNGSDNAGYSDNEMETENDLIERIAARDDRIYEKHIRKFLFSETESGDKDSGINGGEMKHSIEDDYLSEDSVLDIEELEVEIEGPEYFDIVKASKDPHHPKVKIPKDLQKQWSRELETVSRIRYFTQVSNTCRIDSDSMPCSYKTKSETSNIQHSKLDTPPYTPPYSEENTELSCNTEDELRAFMLSNMEISRPNSFTSMSSRARSEVNVAIEPCNVDFEILAKKRFHSRTNILNRGILLETAEKTNVNSIYFQFKDIIPHIRSIQYIEADSDLEHYLVVLTKHDDRNNLIKKLKNSSYRIHKIDSELYQRFISSS